MKQYLRKLFAYNLEQNQKVGRVLLQEENTPSIEKSFELFNHIINAHHVWNARINEKHPVLGIWEVTPLERILIVDKDNFEDSLLLVANRSLDESVSYHNSKGEAFRNTIGDILYHVINHSTYHRGQIALELRRIGIEPLSTDYIFYARKSNR